MGTEIDMFFKQNDPAYRQGFEEGFNFSKEEIISNLKLLIKKIEKLEAYSTITTTETTEI